MAVSMTAPTKSVLITGAASGLGWELAQQCFARGDRLHLVVADDGPGLGDAGGGGFGIGLSNVRDRLRARFGERAEVLTGQAEGGGYRTELIMPLDVNDGK